MDRGRTIFGRSRCSSHGGRHSKPEDRKSKFRVSCLNKRARNASTTVCAFRRTIDQVAKEPAAVIKSDERDDIGLLALPLGLYGSTHDRKCLDYACAATFFPFDRAVAGRTALRGRPAEMIAIAMTSISRSRVLPDVKTFDETVSKGFDAVAWSALFAPAGTPDPSSKNSMPQ